MLDTIIEFLLKRFVISGIFIPIILIIKFRLYKKLENGTERFHHFFYYTYSNIATTHNPQRKKDKKLQNSLFIIFLILLFIQILVALPLILGNHQS